MTNLLEFWNETIYEWMIDDQDIVFEEYINENEMNGSMLKASFLDTPVAIKLFRLQTLPFPTHSPSEPFTNEFLLLSRLRYKHIVRMYGIVYVNQPKYPSLRCWGIVEDLSLCSLRDVIYSSEIQLSPSRFYLIAKQIANGIRFLHSKNIAHCDIKPSNVLVDKSWETKLCDLGVSCHFEQEGGKHLFTDRRGTIAYMAPEVQHCDKKACLLDPTKLDTFSYGILLWECYYRQCPSENLLLKMAIFPSHDEYPLPIVDETCPKELKQLLLSCWRRDPKERPNFTAITKEIDQIFHHPII